MERKLKGKCHAQSCIIISEIYFVTRGKKKRFHVPLNAACTLRFSDLPPLLAPPEAGPDGGFVRLMMLYGVCVCVRVSE